MTAVNFPSSPSNGDTLTSGNTTYTYNSTKTRWDAVTTVNGIQLNSLSVGAEAAASGDGGIAYDNTSGEFTYTPPVTGDSLPAQTDNTGKFLTTDGTDASWATVASGASYEIGTGLELTDPVTTVTWPASPVLTATHVSSLSGRWLGANVAANADYVVGGYESTGGQVEVYNARTGAFIRTISPPTVNTSFGRSCSIDGTNLIVGAPGQSKAYIYNIETGALLHTLSGGLQFGANVEIKGDYALVAGQGIDLGVYNVTTGSLLYTITDPNSDGGSANSDYFAQFGLALTSSHIIAGAPYSDPNGLANAGSFYIFNLSDGSLAATVQGTVANYGHLGNSVSAEGDFVAVYNNNTVVLYSISALVADSSSNPTRTITRAAGLTTLFGYYGLSLSGNYIGIGVTYSNVNGSGAGAAELYDITDGSLVYSIEGAATGDQMGYGVAVAPGVFVAGAPNTDSPAADSGSIFIYNGTVSSTSYLQPDSTIATTSYVDTSVSNLVDSSPAALNTLNELAAALGDDANFSTTVTNSIATKATTASPTFTGVPAAPTAAAGTNTTQIATTAFVAEASAAAASGGGSKEFIANGSITAGDPVVLDTIGTVSSVATIAANGATMAAGDRALFPGYGTNVQDSYVLGRTYQSNYTHINTSAVCATTGRAVFFAVQAYSGRYAFRIQGAIPNASSSEMTLGTPISLQNTGDTGNINICLSGAGDGNFLVTYNSATSYNDAAGASLLARLGNVNSAGEITMYNSVTIAAGRPLSYYGSNDYMAFGADKEWKNSIVWDPIASKFVVVIIGDFDYYQTNTWNANTKIATAFLEYNGSNTLSQNGGEALADVGDYGSFLTKVKSLWDSTRSKVVTLFSSDDRTGSANNDTTSHFSIFEISDGLMSTPVAITTPVPRASLTGTSLVNFSTDMEYNHTQQKFMLIPTTSSYSGNSFFSFAFNGSEVSAVTVNNLPTNLLKGIDDTGVLTYRDITYEASTGSVTIAYSAPNMTYGGTHANKQSIYTATLSAADYTLLSNIEVYDASYRGTSMYNNAPLYEVQAAFYIDLNWSNTLNKFIMFRHTEEEQKSSGQQQRDRYISAYSLVQPTSISNYAEAIGFSEGTASDTTSVPVTLAAGVNGNQSGLTIDTNYYFQPDGSLATTETAYLAGLAISATELQVADLSDLDNVNLSLYASTSAVATKAPLADPTFTGVPSAPTAAAGTSTTQLATTAFVTAAAGDTLPAQTDNTGKFLTTDGTDTSWATVASGAGYEIGDGLELNSVSAVSWPASPNLISTINGSTASKQLGYNIAASADYVVAGYIDHDRVEVYNARTGAFLRSIICPDGTGKRFGKHGIDIDGTNLIVGAPGSGKAYIFDITNGSTLQTFSSASIEFGIHVSIKGNYAAVADYHTSDGGWQGKFTVYNVTTGSQLYVVNNPNAGGGDLGDDFANNGLDMTASYIVAAAMREDGQGVSGSGIAYVFDITNGALLATVLNPNPVANWFFGLGIAADGDYLGVYGGITNNSNVYVYSLSALVANDSASPIYTISNPSPDSNTSDMFGYASVSIAGTYMAVGARGEDVGSGSSGSSYLYDLSDGSLLYTINGAAGDDNMGWSSAVGIGVFVTGSPQNDSGGSNNGSIGIYNGTVSTSDYLQPDNTIITVATLKAEVAASADFAAFKARIAAL